jgi:hypothetical protein
VAAPPTKPSAQAIATARAQQAADTHSPAKQLVLPSPESLEQARAQQDELQRLREENIKAMLNDTIQTTRSSAMPALLQVCQLLSCHTCV